MEVADPAGETWRVKRRWLPWRRRVRDAPDLPIDGGSLLDGDDIFSAILLVVFVAIAIPLIVVFAVMLAELFLLLLLLPIWIVFRLVRGAPWTIEVFSGRELVNTESIRGWRGSQARMLEIADGIQIGRPPLPARRHRREDDAD